MRRHERARRRSGHRSQLTKRGDLAVRAATCRPRRRVRAERAERGERGDEQRAQHRRVVAAESAALTSALLLLDVLRAAIMSQAAQTRTRTHAPTQAQARVRCDAMRREATRRDALRTLEPRRLCKQRSAALSALRQGTFSCILITEKVDTRISARGCRVILGDERAVALVRARAQLHSPQLRAHI